MPAEAFAPAKVNLTLHVTGRRADGYHLLDSLVVFADVGDRVSAAPGAGLTLRVTGPRAEGVPVGGDNLVLRAAQLLGADGVALTLDKHLPAAAGIGGGSSDAAAGLRALSALTGREMPGAEALMRLGADVPVCVAAEASRMQGLGERLSPVAGVPPVWMVLANPGVAVSTPAVFRALASPDNPPMPETLPAWPDAAALAGWLSMQRNDLEAPAMALCPEVEQVLRALSALPGCLLARMSGSGATCFGLFASAGGAAQGAAALSMYQPGWWIADAGLWQDARNGRRVSPSDPDRPRP
ncbi:4-(cytidine 5'-diphospho)-2-C-methyl-D-erythritol kinase [Acidimangrovimonas sediminis]|uniref:4-(cytidine 5'-diphospho)-2-C-methyl-D-erythritol kinase n=1 Tax=Acidimangrovimonas sediminis TaxID=2056283 RepID=UPI000C7F9774|nr:4-(cytidine 5'-diphospho)-2-C-methyl-D-erythritol kinase [Acidimangrovimonas sediminis]